MSKSRLEFNLERLLNELNAYLKANKLEVSGATLPHADKISAEIPLAHSTSGKNLEKICKSGRLLSPQRLHDEGSKSLEANAVEVKLGTAGFVFLYAAAFSFPSSGCGFLFSRSLEDCHGGNGIATPFDSGGLVGHLQSSSCEPAKDFFLRHELPVPQHRKYLCNCIGSLFEEPFDYIDGVGPKHDSPIGLSGGDARRWTHEVRIPSEVAVRSPYLKAVFAPRGLALIPEVKSLINWCLAEGYDLQIFDSDRENDFAKLRKACVEYLREMFY